MAENMFRQIQMADSDVDMGSAADIGNRRLRMDQELATATRGRVQLVYDKTRQSRYLTRNYLFTCKYYTRLYFHNIFSVSPHAADLLVQMKHEYWEACHVHAT
jgi:hypothetical protein